MPQKERLRVWRGEIKKTSGGLTKVDLIRNKRGKIVSRKKSSQAVGDANNLGSWLRGKGDQFQGKPKGYKKKDDDDEKLAEPKPKAKKGVAKKALSTRASLSRKFAAVVDIPIKPLKPKLKKKKKLEPMKAGEKEELHKVSVGNIRSGRRVRKLTEKAKENLKQELRELGASDVQLKKLLESAGLAQANLRASKRKGKKRSKKEILQDVLDV